MDDNWINAPELQHLLILGENIFCELAESRPDEADLIICPTHLGDTIWMGALASAYKAQYKRPILIFVVKESQKEIIRQFPDVDGTLPLADIEMDALQYYILAKRIKMDCTPKDYTSYLQANHLVYAHPTAVDITIKNSKIKGSFLVPTQKLSMFERQKSMMNITGDISLSKMYPLDDGRNKDLATRFGTSVLLMPSAQSVDMIPLSFWEHLASSLTENGYSVYTNYNGFDYEVMINNTTPLSSSIVNLAIMAPYFSQVISSRSGACDLLALTDTNLSILYNALVNEPKILLEKEELDCNNIYDLVDSDYIRNYQWTEQSEDALIQALITVCK